MAKKQRKLTNEGALHERELVAVQRVVSDEVGSNRIRELHGAFPNIEPQTVTKQAELEAAFQGSWPPTESTGFSRVNKPGVV